MIERVTQLCRRLEPVLPDQAKRLWSAYQADTDPTSRARIEHLLELLAQRHLGLGHQPDRSPFVPPKKAWAQSGTLPVGEVVYAGKRYCDFKLEPDRLAEHVLVCGRSGSGKSTLTLHLARGLMEQGVVVTAFDWKRSYRDLLHDVPPGTLRVRTPGRDVAPFFWNPLIPPPGTDPVLYAKLIVDVISRALLGGDGVISLLHRGILALYEREGVGTDQQRRWPTIHDLLEWLSSTKLTGRAAMWKSSADRILRAMTYGQFGRMIDTQTNADVLALLDTHHVLELDGLAGSADRRIFAEGVTLWLYRCLLHRGERKHLERVWIHEEAHHLFSQGESGSTESVLEHSLRMARAYGVGYMVVDQTASMLSKTVFSNTGTVFALNQKLRSDVQAIAGAMNLDDTQRQAVSTLPLGTAIARVPDGHPEPFLVKIPPPEDRPHVSDEEVRRSGAAVPAEKRRAMNPSAEDEIVRLYRALCDHASNAETATSEPTTTANSSRTDSTDSGAIRSTQSTGRAITAVPPSEKYPLRIQPTTPTDPRRGEQPTQPPEPDAVMKKDNDRSVIDHQKSKPSITTPSESKPPPSTPEDSAPEDSEPDHNDNPQRAAVLPAAAHSAAAVRMLRDLVEHPLSTTVERYNRLRLSRRKGHALRTALIDADLIRPVRIPTRSGVVVLVELTSRGRQHCNSLGLPLPRTGSAGIAHRYWAQRVGTALESEGYAVTFETHVDGNGRIDLLARKGEIQLPCEVETGRSNTDANVASALKHFDKLLVIATNPEASEKCIAAIGKLPASQRRRIELKTWLDY